MEERRNEEKKTMLDKELYTYTMYLLENRKSVKGRVVKGVMEMYGTYLAVLFRHFNLPNFVPLTDKYPKRKMSLILTRES